MLGVPQDWTLIGEGAANAVFTYTGERTDLARTPTVVQLHPCQRTARMPCRACPEPPAPPSQVGKVLRIGKPKSASAVPDPPHAALDQRIWSVHPSLQTPGRHFFSSGETYVLSA